MSLLPLTQNDQKNRRLGLSTEIQNYKKQKLGARALKRQNFKVFKLFSDIIKSFQIVCKQFVVKFERKYFFTRNVSSLLMSTNTIYIEHLLL